MKVLIQHGKYDNTYYDASTDEQLGKAALIILADHHRLGYYDAPDAPKPLAFDLTAIPESLHNEAQRQLDRAKASERYYRDALMQLNKIQQVLQDKSGFAAWQILLSRSLHEYEEVELIELIDPIAGESV